MSFFDDINAGVTEAVSTMGESFTLSNHTGDFRGVFAGDDSPTSFDDIQGHDTEISNSVSVSKSLFVSGAPPMINESLTDSKGGIYVITGVNSVDDATWDLILQKNDG